MTWVAAGALAGLAFVALPILIHMMGRAPAKVRTFPSLRFLVASRLLPARRTKIQDPLLLALRVLALVLAAVALAGPVLESAGPKDDADRQVVVAIVDTSSSVAQPPTDEEVNRRITDAAGSVIIRTANVRSALSGARAYASGLGPRASSLMIFSDFQLGTLDSADIRALPAGTKVSFVRRATKDNDGSHLRLSQGGREIDLAMSQPDDAMLGVTWKGMASSEPLGIELLGDERERAGASAAATAALASGTRVRESVVRQNIAIVFPGAPQRATMLRDVRTVVSPAHAGIIAALASDPILADAIARDSAVTGSDMGAATTLLSDERGRPALAVGSAGDKLLFFANFRSSSFASAALQAALARALAGPLNASEFDVRSLTDAQLAALASLPAGSSAETVAPARPTESPAARWLWIVALLALGAEWVLRNRLTASRAVEAADVAA